MEEDERWFDSVRGEWMDPLTDEYYPPDDKGRKNVVRMSDRELAEEQVSAMRATQDLVEGFIENFAKNPMFGMVSKMMGK